MKVEIVDWSISPSIRRSLFLGRKLNKGAGHFIGGSRPDDTINSITTMVKNTRTWSSQILSKALG